MSGRPCQVITGHRSCKGQGLTSVPFGCDRPQFDAYGVQALLKVRQCVAIPAQVLLTATTKRATGEAEPEILLEIAFRAVCQSYATK